MPPSVETSMYHLFYKMLHLHQLTLLPVTFFIAPHPSQNLEPMKLFFANPVGTKWHR